MCSAEDFLSRKEQVPGGQKEMLLQYAFQKSLDML